MMKRTMKLTLGKGLSLLIFALSLLICVSCDTGQLEGADETGTYRPGNRVFAERMEFFEGVWYSGYPGIGLLDGYRIHKWGNLTSADKAAITKLFPSVNIDRPVTYSSRRSPENGDYILLYNDTVYGEEEDGPQGGMGMSTGYVGLVRAVNIFNNDLARGAIIIEYFEGGDPKWLSTTIEGEGWTIPSQGLRPGEKPFFGMYYRALYQNTVQMANAVDLAALYAGRPYYTEKATLEEAIATNTVEYEAEYISWGVVQPQSRQ